VERAWSVLGLPAALPVADPLPEVAVAGLLVAVAVLMPLTLAGPAWMALQRAPPPALQGRTAGEGPWGQRARQGLLTLQLAGALLLSALGVLQRPARRRHARAAGTARQRHAAQAGAACRRVSQRFFDTYGTAQGRARWRRR